MGPVRLTRESMYLVEVECRLVKCLIQQIGPGNCFRHSHIRAPLSPA
jgi:hypothetical protein